MPVEDNKRRSADKKFINRYYEPKASNDYKKWRLANEETILSKPRNKANEALDEIRSVKNTLRSLKKEINKIKAERC